MTLNDCNIGGKFHLPGSGKTWILFDLGEYQDEATNEIELYAHCRRTTDRLNKNGVSKYEILPLTTVISKLV